VRSVAAYAGLRSVSPALTIVPSGLVRERAVGEASQALRNDETLLGRADGCVEQRLPGQAAVLRVHEAQHRDGPRHARRTPARDGI
jgi:hypothetical protein